MISITNHKSMMKKNKTYRSKKKRYANKKHMDWIHGFPCCLQSNRDCLGAVQAHHLMKPWDGVRGMGLKATDRNLIPLCQRHHIMLHKRGNELAFFEEQTGDSDYGKVTARRYWERSPYNEI